MAEKNSFRLKFDSNSTGFSHAIDSKKKSIGMKIISSTSHRKNVMRVFAKVVTSMIFTKLKSEGDFL